MCYWVSKKIEPIHTITMKFQNIIMCFSLVLMLSCGSSERVITDEGKVYEVKGNTIKNDGNNVTKNLSAEEKEAINTVLERKENAKKAFDKKQKELEDAIEEQENIQEAAENKQKELEEELETLEDSLKESQDARDNYATIKARYNDKRNKFRKLKKEGKLSPNDIEDWKEKLEKIKEDVNEAKNKL